MQTLVLTAALFLSITSASWASAQITTATLSGIVKDDSGDVLPGVVVTVRNLDTTLRREPAELQNRGPHQYSR